jgi:hypothetical protein
MAKPSLLTHPKFRRLVHELGIPEAYAVGLLECMWHVGYETGNDVLGDATDWPIVASASVTGPRRSGG